jgi:glucose dehydrogenase
MRVITQGLRAFGHFWWDFLIGDAPEFFVAGAVIAVLALLLRHHRQAAYVVIPLVTVLVLVASTFRAARRARRA